MMALVLESVFFILPAGLANMAPVVARKMGMPVIGVISRKWLGEHKTWLGLLSGILAGILTIYLQRYLVGFDFFGRLALLDYMTVEALVLGGLMGFGALFGDLVESFFKRRIGIKPGSAWVPFDQIDFLIGALLFGAILIFPGWERVLVLVIITPLLHFLTNVLGYWLGFKKVWW